MRKLREFGKNASGHVAIMFAMSAMTLGIFIAFATHGGAILNQKNALQEAVDATTLSMASERAILSMTKIDVESAARARLAAQIGGKRAIRDLDFVVTAKLSSSQDALDAVSATGTPPEKDEIQISVTQEPFSTIETILGWPETKPVTVTAKARRVGQKNVCIVALNQADNSTLLLANQGTITAPNCEIISNSVSPTGMQALDSSRLTAKNTYTAGGYSGGAVNYAPLPLTDAPPVIDPFSNFPWPAEGPCDVTTNQPISGTSGTLNPGVYCAGLQIHGNHEVTLNPGVYILKGDGLNVVGTSQLRGDGVTIYFKGPTSRLQAVGNATLELTAPTGGATAGFLMIEDPGNQAGNTHLITASNARYMVGTIYLPRGVLRVDTSNPVSDQSEYTAIVASQIQTLGDSNLYLNTDYALTDVPVPNGVGPVGEKMRLID